MILIAGGCSVIPYSDQFLKDKLKVDVDYLNPFTNVPVSPSISAEEIGKSAQVLAQLVGVALRRVHSCPIEINLLPPHVVADKAFKKKQPLLIAASFGVALVVGLLALFFWRTTALTHRQLDAVKGRVQELTAVERPLKQAEAELKATEDKLASYDALLKSRQDWLGIVAQIQSVMPKGLWISKLTPIRATASAASADAAPGSTPVAPGSVTKIEIIGHGYIDEVASATPILGFRDRLRTLPLFTEGTEITWSPSPISGEFVRNFKIEVALRNPITP